MNPILPKKDKHGDYYLDLRVILGGMTTSVNTVKFYHMETKEDGSIVLTLFDKNEKRIKVGKKMIDLE